MKKLLLTLIVSLAMCGSIFAQQYESHWPDFRYTAFLSQNPIVAAIAIDGEIVTTENHPDNWNALEVAFFVGDECRGAGAAFGSYSPEVNYLDDSFVGEGGDPYPTIAGAPIYFNTATGEEVTVKMFDHVNGIEYNECTVTLSGASYVIRTGVDHTQGWDDPENPIILNFTSPAACEKIVLNGDGEWTRDFDNVTGATPDNGFTFETMGDCWTWNSLVELPAGYDADTVPQIFYRENFAPSGAYSLVMWHRGVYALPELDENIDINQLKMSFKVRHPHPFYTLMVGVMDEPEDEDSFKPVAYVDNGISTAFEDFVFDFSKYTGEGRYIAFKNVRPSESHFDATWNDIHSVNYIDDIKLSLINEVPACVEGLPYEQNFDQVTPSTNALTGATPECWEMVQNESGEEIPLLDEKMPMVYRGVAYNSNYSLRMVNRCVYALPALEETDLSKLQLSMQVLQPKTRYQLEVGVWDMQNAEFVPLTLVNNATTDYEEIVCDFSAYNGSAGRIAFRNVLGNGYDYDYSYNYIDDIKVSYKVECDEVIELGHTESFDGYTESTEALTGEEPDCWELVQQDVVMPKNKKPQLCYSGDNYYLAMLYRGVYAMPSLETGVEIQNLHLSMKLRQPNKSYRLEVGVWEPGEGSEPGVFVPVHVFNNNITETFVECDFSDYTGTGGRIAFRNTLGNGKTWDYSYNYIDDVTLDYNATEARNNVSGANMIDEIGVERYLEGIAVYPNPTTGVLHIGAMDVQKVECYNQMGQLVAVYDNENNISINSLANGVYTLRITVPQGVTMRKVVKR